MGPFNAACIGSSLTKMSTVRDSRPDAGDSVKDHVPGESGQVRWKMGPYVSIIGRLPLPISPSIKSEVVARDVQGDLSQADVFS